MKKQTANKWVDKKMCMTLGFAWLQYWHCQHKNVQRLRLLDYGDSATNNQRKISFNSQVFSFVSLWKKFHIASGYCVVTFIISYLSPCFKHDMQKNTVGNSPECAHTIMNGQKDGDGGGYVRMSGNAVTAKCHCCQRLMAWGQTWRNWFSLVCSPTPDNETWEEVFKVVVT